MTADSPRLPAPELCPLPDLTRIEARLDKARRMIRRLTRWRLLCNAAAAGSALGIADSPEATPAEELFALLERRRPEPGEAADYWRTLLQDDADLVDDPIVAFRLAETRRVVTPPAAAT